MKKTAMYWKAGILCFLILSVASTSLEAQRGYHYYGYGGYYPVRAQYFGHIPGPYISVNFGGYPYYYSNGLFYQPYGSSFQLIAPPFGIRVGFLPQGYWPLSWGGYPYYYYNGIFYRPYDREYEVVQAPVGAEVPSIPRDARTVVIDGRKYYEYNGTYFSDFVKPNGEIWYRVDGKHGVLNTDRNNNNAAPPANPQPHTYNVPRTVLPSQQQPATVQPSTAQQSQQAVVTQQEPATSSQTPVQTQEIRTSSQPATTLDTKITPPVVTQQPVVAQPPASTTVTSTVQQARTSQQPAADKPTIGEVFDSLPADSKTVVISSKKYFLSPDNLYYEEVMDGKQLRYKVAGRVM